MAASRAGKSVVYYPFDNQDLYDDWKEVQQRIQGKEIQVSDLMRFFEAMEPRNILKQFLTFVIFSLLVSSMMMGDFCLWASLMQGWFYIFDDGGGCWWASSMESGFFSLSERGFCCGLFYN